VFVKYDFFKAPILRAQRCKKMLGTDIILCQALSQLYIGFHEPSLSSAFLRVKPRFGACTVKTGGKAIFFILKQAIRSSYR
jgi:hypothetical protein